MKCFPPEPAPFLPASFRSKGGLRVAPLPCPLSPTVSEGRLCASEEDGGMPGAVPVVSPKRD